VICEPGSEGLRSAIQSFAISFSKRLNAKVGRTGEVFLDRYHLHVLRTPTEVSNALECVLTNQARHETKSANTGRSSRNQKSLRVHLDSYSSAYSFKDWKELLGSRVHFKFSSEAESRLEAWHEAILTQPRTWLLKQGWKRGAQPT
jgi:hypothetical protein